MDPAAFRRLLEGGDVAGLVAAWDQVMPGMPQPRNYQQAEIVMHMARTSTCTLHIRYRLYSHRWLEERGLPSQLPDFMRPPAEQVVPRAVGAVGISVNMRSEWMRPAAAEVQNAMAHAVEDCYALGDEAPEIVKPRMMEAKAKAMKALFGR